MENEYSNIMENLLMEEIQKNETPVDETAEIVVPRDEHVAYVQFTAPSGAGRLLTRDDIYAMLEEARVIFGIRSHMIDEWASNPEKPYGVRLEVATALLAVPGDDAWIEYRFKIIHDRMPRILEDGSVDHKSLDLFDNVVIGDVLAKKHPETEGSPGYSVRGNRLYPKRGKQIKLRAGQNAALSPDGMEIIAAADGRVELIEDRVCVLKVLGIDGDVSAATGNIKFNGDVYIGGSILSQYTVSASGSIEVRGVIEAAEVKAGGDIIVRQGIKGKGRCEIIASGSITAQFIENATVRAGNIVRAGSIMHSSVVSNRAVVAEGKHGIITGGWVHGTKAVTAGSILATGGGKTLITTGVNPDIRRRYLQVLEEIEEQKARLQERVKEYEYRLQQEQRGRPFRTKSTKMKHIIRDDNALSKKKMEREAIREMIQQSAGGFIHVRQNLQQGVQVEVGPVHAMLEIPYENVTLLRSADRLQITDYFHEKLQKY